jgi:prepilin-type N-terminal cleavage/methylation domain-containing protein
MEQKNKNKKNGFTLIEVLIGLFILIVAVLSIYSLFNMSLKVVFESRAKITATQLANEKLEMTRNLPYNSVGTIAGIPAGTIPQTENISRNGIDFTVNTTVQYIDDPFDGISGGEPNDILPIDYKRVRVEVAWNSRYGNKKMVFITDISPKEIESISGGGTLKITVFDSAGKAVPQAMVNIINNSVDPAINLETQTDNFGILILPGTPESIEGYNVYISKNGYSTDQTYSETEEMPTSIKPPITVREGNLTSISFSIDLIASLDIFVKNTNGIGLSNTDIKIKNQKIIGYDETGKPVYKYDEIKTTNSLGHIILNNMETESYDFSISESEPYNLSETNPIQPIDLLPGDNAQIDLTLSPKSQNSVLIIVKDVNENPIQDASVRLFDELYSLDETATTTETGQIYFAPWQKTTTTMEVIKTGYENYNYIFLVDGYDTETVIMTEP